MVKIMWCESSLLRVTQMAFTLFYRQNLNRMPKRKQAHNACIQDLCNKSRKVQDQEMNAGAWYSSLLIITWLISTTVLDTAHPTFPSSEGCHNGNRDCCSESPECEHFHLNLQSTQTDNKRSWKMCIHVAPCWQLQADHKEENKGPEGSAS